MARKLIILTSQDNPPCVHKVEIFAPQLSFYDRYYTKLAWNVPSGYRNILSDPTFKGEGGREGGMRERERGREGGGEVRERGKEG